MVRTLVGYSTVWTVISVVVVGFGLALLGIIGLVYTLRLVLS